MRLPSSKKRSLPKGLVYGFIFVVVFSGIAYALPLMLAITIKSEQSQIISTLTDQFPITVDPKNKVIVENAQVNIRLDSALSSFQAAAGNVFLDAFDWVATALSEIPWYENVAALGGRFVTITPGMRKEQVASAFATALSWTSSEKKEFITLRGESPPSLAEGTFSPGVYYVALGMTPTDAQAVVETRFYNDILSHYSTTTAEIVPLKDALTVASLIEREASPDDMRVVSGIIWKRLFSNMRLQIDATVQYAKASKSTTGSWWPQVWPGDTSIKSAYNTYLHEGLPPTPIASPSVAAVLAALNPVNTDCLFYFHDRHGQIHCTETYEEHITLLKKYYGQGK